MSNSVANSPGAGHLRLAGLDTLRGIAILLVLFRHLGMPPLKESAHWSLQVLSLLQCGGWVGVDLFFVLSGFLVSGLLFRQQRELGRLELRKFLVRRGFKIYPAFWVMLVCMVAFRWFVYAEFSWRKLFVELLFVQNYFPPSYCGYTWSLAVEEHFYLLLAGLFWIWPRSRQESGLQQESGSAFRGLPVFCGCVIALECGLRWVLARQYSLVSLESFVWTHLRLDGFLWGVILAYLYDAYPAAFLRAARLCRWPAIVIGICCLVPSFLLDVDKNEPVFKSLALPTWLNRNWLMAYGVTLQALAGMLWTLAALGSPQRKRPGVLAWIGRYSYGIYLWHMLLGFYGSRLVLQSLNIRLGFLKWAVLYLVLSILVGYVMTRLIEEPALWLREKLVPNSRKHSTTPVSVTVASEADHAVTTV